MEELTEFQVVCETKLSGALSSINLKLCDKELGEITDTYFDHANETYIHASVDGTGIEVWIYDNGAAFSGPGIDMRYEHEDYANKEKLMDAFVMEILVAVNKKRA